MLMNVNAVVAYPGAVYIESTRGHKRNLQHANCQKVRAAISHKHARVDNRCCSHRQPKT